MPKTSEISLNISCLHKHESYLYPMLPFEFGIAVKNLTEVHIFYRYGRVSMNFAGYQMIPIGSC